MLRWSAVAALACMYFSWHTVSAQEQPGSSGNEMARLIAGLAPSRDTPEATAASSDAWRTHARELDSAWTELERRQLTKVRAWSQAHLTAPRSSVFYMFSGPDILYANALFPKASTYVLSGLEPIGPIPEMSRVKSKSLDGDLGRLRKSLTQLLSHSYFITMEMDSQLRSGTFRGTLPVLYVFLARTGHTIRQASYVRLESDGAVHPYQESPDTTPRAVRILFAGADGREQTLYYFSTDLSNRGVADSGFLKFCEKLGPADSFVKSASYLMHGSDFSSVREFLLANSALILQDDTGIPVRDFKTDRWELQPFGKYTGPIPQFSGSYQKRLAELFAKGKPGPMDFGLGYKWRPGQSHLVRAIRKDLRAATP